MVTAFLKLQCKLPYAFFARSLNCHFEANIQNGHAVINSYQKISFLFSLDLTKMRGLKKVSNRQVYSRNTTDKHVYCAFKRTKNKGNKFVFTCFPIENQWFN